MAKKQKLPAEHRNWYKDRYQSVLVQRKLLATFTVLSLFLSMLLALYISNVTPLIRVEPFVIQVDKKTGIMKTVNPASTIAKKLTASEAVNNANIVKYVRARENYNINDLARNYNTVRVMSDSVRVYSQFVAAADPNNPSSNAARLGSGGSRHSKIKSLSYIKPNQVQIRLLIEEVSAGNVTELHKIVLLNFEYIKLSLSTEERYINPLGFRITNYRIDDELF